MNEFLARLKQRKLVQWAIAYVAAAFALLQGIDIVAQQFGWPEGMRRGITVGLVVGFFVTLVLAWYHGERGAQRVTGTELLIIGLVLALGGGLLWHFAAASRTADNKVATLPNESRTPEPAVFIPEKSIAVLPFENLSRDPDNAYFTDGVQDEILTYLAKIADLKVISRVSVMQYKSGIDRNLRKIGEDLGVAHVLEGSVQRAGNKVRVNAQLIDARNDRHEWAENYDRPIDDVFAIQSEIAKTIADQLKAKLTPNEKAAINKPPTVDLAAFDLYSRAKTLVFSISFGALHRQSLFQAADLLNQAVARDPDFFQAYCLLVYTQSNIYFFHDHTAGRLALAEIALQAAFRLQPEAGEVHLARAQHLYWGYRDYEAALVELAIARRSLPNDPRTFELAAYIRRRQGRSEEVLPNLQRALELDPRNVFTLQQTGLFYGNLHRFAEMAATLDRVISIKPDDAETRAARGMVDLDWKASTQYLHQAIDQIRAKDPGALKNVADYCFTLALAERDAAGASQALTALGDNYLTTNTIELSRHFCEGLAARMIKDDAKALVAFGAALTEQEKRVQVQPDYGPALCVLSLIHAGLGRKEDALRESQRAIELLPIEKDSINGFHMIEYSAVAAAWVVEKDLACEELTRANSLPGYGINTYGQLKLSPFWDPLRGDPRFEKIVASLVPKEN